MTTAIYIAEGVVQLVLTPENEFEKDVLGMLEKDKRDLGIYRGEFYDCNGGWIRWKESYSNYDHNRRDNSLIFRLDRATPPPSVASD